MANERAVGHFLEKQVGAGDTRSSYGGSMYIIAARLRNSHMETDKHVKVTEHKQHLLQMRDYRREAIELQQQLRQLRKERKESTYFTGTNIRQHLWDGMQKTKLRKESGPAYTQTFRRQSTEYIPSFFDDSSETRFCKSISPRGQKKYNDNFSTKKQAPPDFRLKRHPTTLMMVNGVSAADEIQLQQQHLQMHRLNGSDAVIKPESTSVDKERAVKKSPRRRRRGGEDGEVTIQGYYLDTLHGGFVLNQGDNEDALQQTQTLQAAVGKKGNHRDVRKQSNSVDDIHKLLKVTRLGALDGSSN